MMTGKEDIHCRVPDGYFDDLKNRLDAIPYEESKMTRWDKVKPYVALAASFVILVTGGTALLRYAAGYMSAGEDTTLDRMQLADLVPVTDPYVIYDREDADTDGVSQDDIAAYLIDSGTTLEHIEYYENK